MRWEAVHLPGAPRAALSAELRSALLAGGALLPAVEERLLLRWPPLKPRPTSQSARTARWRAEVRRQWQGVALSPAPAPAPPAPVGLAWQVPSEAEVPEVPEVSEVVATEVADPGCVDLSQSAEPGLASLAAQEFAREMVQRALRRRTLQSGLDRSAWPRLRVPVDSRAWPKAWADAWPEALSRCIADLRPQGPRQAVEVVAVRSIEEELRLICGSRGQVPGRSHGHTLPAIGSMRCLQWYGELAAVAEHLGEASGACWVLEFALAPPADDKAAEVLAKSIQGHLARPLCATTREPRIAAVHGAVVHREAEVWSLGQLVPRQVSRIFAWPPRRDLTLPQRAVLRANPNAQWAQPR
ncbi:unnamed protein product [Effrenium voratum]|nr:unnamed protein product [Effrenium voratum]